MTTKHSDHELFLLQRQRDLVLALAELSAESGDTKHYIRRALEVIARGYDWVLAQYWVIDEKRESTFCTELHFSSVRLPELRQASLERRLSKGVGLPGRVWSTGLPIAIPDVESEIHMNFPRKAAAIKWGIKSAYAFPLKNGPFVNGIFEFFSFESIIMRDVDNLFFEKIGRNLANEITQRDTQESARLRENQEKHILDHANLAFIAIDEASVITQWSAKAAEVFGWEKDEVIGKLLAEVIIPQRYREAHMKGVLRYMTTAEGPVIERPVHAPALTKTGREIRVELMIFPIDADTRRSFGAFIRDLSEQAKPPEVELS